MQHTRHKSHRTVRGAFRRSNELSENPAGPAARAVKSIRVPVLADDTPEDARNRTFWWLIAEGASLEVASKAAEQIQQRVIASRRWTFWRRWRRGRGSDRALH
jgi:hypothetical protein